MKYLIALDAGTTSVRAMLFDLKAQKFVYTAQSEIGQTYPQSGWVEEDGEEIFQKCQAALLDCVKAANGGTVLGVGIANQRETVLLWDRRTGKPVSPAVVWQCRRTSEFCKNIPKDMQARILEKTGLLCDAYFSASKIKWLLENTPNLQPLLKGEQLCAGTIDSFLIFRLTGNFITDHTNASRTMLFDVKNLRWDEELLAFFGVPKHILATPVPCTARLGETLIAGQNIQVAGCAGDQQAALLGQGCLHAGDAKATFGTGLFLLFPTGERFAPSKRGLLTTIAYTLFDKTVYTLEGSAFHAGSAVKWLRDGLGLLKTSAESEEIAESVKDSGRVYFVPAFTGLGVPHWDGDARGLFSGLTLATTRAHLVRAVLESIAFETKELCELLQAESGVPLCTLKCDGGASRNGFLMQFLADLLRIPIDRPTEPECTALGAALLCGLTLDVFKEGDFERIRTSEKIFTPAMAQDKADMLYKGYLNAVKRAILKP